MKILIGCEFSGIVREAFKAKGHDAWSCDLLDTEIPGNHIKGDILEVLNDGWDLGIFHPPCTYLARVAIQHNKKPGRLELREKAIIFFLKLKNANINKIVIENPRPQQYVWEKVGKWDQVIQPYYFGDPFSKATCLWLKNLPKLEHFKEDDLFEKNTHVDRGEFYKNKNGRTNAKWYSCNKKERSRTFQGIADTMANQWNFQQ